MNLSPESAPGPDTLGQAKAELVRRMEQACQNGLGGGLPETTGELLRLEDALVAATRATEDVLALRRRKRGRKPGASSRRDEEVPLEQGKERIREFRDSAGAEWRVWAVTPGMASPTSQRHLGEQLRDGWLAFEALDGGARRRLASYPSDWLDFNDNQLLELLQLAAEAPIRKRPEPDA